MQVDRNIASARRIVDEVINRGDLLAFEELVHHDYIDRSDDEPFGKDTYRELVLATRTAVPDLCMTIEDVIAQDDKVVIRLELRATHTGDFLIPATGKPFILRGIGIFRFADGKLIERWNISDAFGMLQQLGATFVAPDSEASH